MAKGVMQLVDKCLTVDELWPKTNGGRDMTGLTYEEESELVTRLKDQVDMLRKYAFMVFPK